MLSFRIVVCIYDVAQNAAHFFTDVNRNLVLIVDGQQHFVHAALLCKFQSEAEDLLAVSFSLFRYSDGIPDAPDILHDLFGKFGPELKFSDELSVVDCPIVKTDRLTFDQPLFFFVVPGFCTKKPVFVNILRVCGTEIDDPVIIHFLAVRFVSRQIFGTSFDQFHHPRSLRIVVFPAVICPARPPGSAQRRPPSGESPPA